jgi:hypothetical protein
MTTDCGESLRSLCCVYLHVHVYGWVSNDAMVFVITGVSMFLFMVKSGLQSSDREL